MAFIASNATKYQISGTNNCAQAFLTSFLIYKNRLSHTARQNVCSVDYGGSHLENLKGVPGRSYIMANWDSLGKSGRVPMLLTMSVEYRTWIPKVKFVWIKLILTGMPRVNRIYLLFFIISLYQIWRLLNSQTTLDSRELSPVETFVQ